MPETDRPKLKRQHFPMSPNVFGPEPGISQQLRLLAHVVFKTLGAFLTTHLRRPNPSCVAAQRDA
jgi:hypothetical protein